MVAGASGEQSKTICAGLTPDAALLDDARNGFHRRFPQRSAKWVVTWLQAFVLLVLGMALSYGLYRAPLPAWRLAHAIAFVLFAFALIWRLFAAASLERLRLSRLFEPSPGESWPIFTLLCPLYREANVVFDLVAALERLDYPTNALDIKILVEADDADTLSAALAAARASHIEVVLIPASEPRTKPKALNVGLAMARGDYVGVYDAEDRPHPVQLRAAAQAFADGGAHLACVQAPLTIDNAGASWIAQQFAAEYAIQFREMLPLLARLKLPLPLGGSSNHFRASTLRAIGGWDVYNVTEDADLGFRLAREGYRAHMIAPPTYEEAPIGFSAWLNQRTRWIKGHLQTYLVLMRNPFALTRELGLSGFFALHMTLGAGLAGAFLHGPLFVFLIASALAHWNALSTPDLILVLCGYCVAAFSALTASALSGELAYARAALSMPFYWPLSSIAAVRALGALAFRPHRWAKTAHGVSARHSPVFSARRAKAVQNPNL